MSPDADSNSFQFDKTDLSPDAAIGKDRIVVVEETRNRLVIHISGGGEHANRLGWIAIFFGSAMCFVLYLLWFGDFPRRPAHFFAQFETMTYTVVGLFLCVWGPLLWVKWQFERTALLVEEGQLAIQRILFGWRRIEQVTLRRESRAAVVHSPHRGRIAPHVIAVAGVETCLKFGQKLTHEEQVWVASRINRFLGATDYHRDDAE